MGFGLGYIIITLALLAIITPFLVSWSAEYGNPATAIALGSKFNNTYGYYYYTNNDVNCSTPCNTNNSNIAFHNGSFQQNVYNPLVNNTKLGVSASNQEGASASLFGFLGAFILPGFANIFASVFNAPSIVATWLTVLLGVVPLSQTGLSMPTIISFVLDVALIAACCWCLSLWQKYPSWSQS